MNNNKNIMQKKQQGLSLIELLIAMLIGLFLLTGIATSYISSKKSDNQRNELTTLEDNGRIALEVLSGVLEHTGYTPIHAGILNPPFITNNADVVTEACGAGNGVVNTGLFTPATMTQDKVAGDAITVVYNGDNRVNTDCSGGQLPPACQVAPPNVAATGGSSLGSRIYNAFYLQGRELRCAGSRDNNAQVIADGIENIQFLYGLDTTDNGDVNQYANATAVTAAGAWNNVVSIQIAVLVRSKRPVKPQNEQINYTLLDQNFAAPKDKFKRAVFTTTVRIRNTL